MAGFSPLKKNADRFFAAAAGFIIIFFFTRHGGIGIEPDSVAYLSTAENLHAHGKLADFTGSPLVDFPAGYPFFLSVITLLTGIKPLVFAPILNALLFATIIYLSGYIMDRFVNFSKGYKWVILTCIVVSPCLLEVYSFLMSESLFVVVEMLFFIGLFRYFRSHSLKTLIAVAMLAAFASVTRYAGITIIGIGGLLLLADGHLSLQKKIKHLAVYAVISPALLIINLARNYAVSGTLTGGREVSVSSLRENIHDAGTVFYDWLPFLQGHYKGAGLLFLLLVAGLGFFCTRRFLRNHRLAGFEDITAVYAVIYLLFIVVIASMSRFEGLNSRFLSPVFIPLLWSCSHWIIAALKDLDPSKRKWLLVTGVAGFLLFQYGQFAADYETWDGVKDAGIPGYTEDQWRYSETVQFIQKDSLSFQKGFTIYSDASDAIYFFTGRVGQFLPHKEYKPGVESFLADRHCYVVWFDDGENTDLVNKDFITGTKKMKLVKQFNDGAIYEFDE